MLKGRLLERKQKRQNPLRKVNLKSIVLKLKKKLPSMKVGRLEMSKAIYYSSRTGLLNS